MWTSKEVLLISIAAALASCFATFYAQRKFTSYIERKVQAKTINPLLGIMNNETFPNNSINATSIYKQEKEPTEFAQMVSTPKQQVQYPPSPPGSGKKWKIGEGWGAFHPDKMNVYYGPPEIIPNTSTAKFTVKHKPKTFVYQGQDVEIPFQVSLLSSQKSFKQQYGRWECRCTIPFNPWVWPAFWMWNYLAT